MLNFKLCLAVLYCLYPTLMQVLNSGMRVWYRPTVVILDLSLDILGTQSSSDGLMFYEVFAWANPTHMIWTREGFRHHWPVSLNWIVIVSNHIAVMLLDCFSKLLVLDSQVFTRRLMVLIWCHVLRSQSSQLLVRAQKAVWHITVCCREYMSVLGLLVLSRCRLDVCQRWRHLIGHWSSSIWRLSWLHIDFLRHAIMQWVLDLSRRCKVNICLWRHCQV